MLAKITSGPCLSPVDRPMELSYRGGVLYRPAGRKDKPVVGQVKRDMVDP